jgi:DNA replication initiation complex subunit (GINS family)
LQPLPKNFVSEFSEYLKEKKDAASKEDDEFSDVQLKMKKQLENAITLFKELMLRRKKKLLSLVLIATETGISKQDFNHMLQFEKDLFEDLMKCMEASDKKLNESLNGGSVERVVKNDLVVFLEDVSEFVGFDGGKVGPFEIGEMANLPKEIAKILIDDKKVELVG